MKILQNKSDATEVIAHDVSPLQVNTDARKYTRLGWIIAVVGVGGFLLWALTAPLDRGVPLSGTVIKEGNRKAVQFQNGGTIDQILVSEGDTVKAGQVLVRMNAVAAKAQAEMAQMQLQVARAAEARLLAERDGHDSIKFPKDLLAKKNSDIRLASTIEGQSMLFSARRMALQSELAASSDMETGFKMQLQGIEESRSNKRIQLDILKEQLTNMRDLAKEGYVPRSRLLDLERSFAQVNGSIAEDTGNIGRARQQILELARRREQRLQEYQKEVRSQLADMQREVDSLRSRGTALDYELANTDVKAPVDGVVVGMSVFTAGGVVSPGFRMMDLVPANDALVVEGSLMVNLIDKVKPGLKVELIFSAFNSNVTPHIEGEVIQVAADRTIDEHSGLPYYKVKARVTPAGTKKMAALKLDVKPGMPVDLFVKTGERTMMSYLLKPVFDRAKTSMTEE